MEIKRRRCGNRDGDMAIEFWRWRYGDGDMVMEIWRWRWS